MCRESGGIKITCEYRGMRERDHCKPNNWNISANKKASFPGRNPENKAKIQVVVDDITVCFSLSTAYAPALEARAIVSLQMGNLFGALLDITSALKVPNQ